MTAAPVPIAHFTALKSRQRAIRQGWPNPIAPRIHRAISWIGRAEMEEQEAFSRCFGRLSALDRIWRHLVALGGTGRLLALV